MIEASVPSLNCKEMRRSVRAGNIGEDETSDKGGMYSPSLRRQMCAVWDIYYYEVDSVTCVIYHRNFTNS